MPQTILIPTDFSIESLNTLKSILKNNSENCQYHIILLHGYHLSDSITDLLFFPKYKHIETITPGKFKEACALLKNKFSTHICSLKVDLFTGYNTRAFKNYLEANHIDNIYIADNYKPVLNHKSSFDITPFIRKSKYKTSVIPCHTEVSLEKNSMAHLLINTEPVMATQ